MKNKLENQFKVVINLHGLACCIKEVTYLYLSIEDLRNVAQRMSVNVEELILDDEFNTFNHREVKLICKGLTLSNKSQVEIRINGRKRRTIYFQELIEQGDYLFPIYDVSINELELPMNENTYIIEQEMGLISSYTFVSDKFEMDFLKFEVSRVFINKQEQLILNKVSYNDKELQSNKSDTVLVGSYGVLV